MHYDSITWLDVVSLNMVYAFYFSKYIAATTNTNYKINMSALIPIPSTSEYDEVLVLLRHLPQDLQRKWHTPHQLNSIIARGGFPSLPPMFISKALQSNRNNNRFIEKNTYRNKRWVCFDAINKEYDTPKAQLLALEAAFTSEKKKSIRPTIPKDYFYKFELNYLRKYKTIDNTSPTSNTPTTTPAVPTNPTVSSSTPTVPTNPTVSSPTTTSNTSNNNTSTPLSANTNVILPTEPSPTPTSNTTNNNTSTLSSINTNVTQLPKSMNSDSPPTATSPPNPSDRSHVHTIPATNGDGKKIGMVIMDINTVDTFMTDVVEKHAHDCPDGSLKVVSNTRFGYELDRGFHCNVCNMSYQMSTGPKEDDVPGARKKQGRNMRPINKIMATAIFSSGAPMKQVQEIFNENGLVCPSDTGLGKMVDNVEKAVDYVSEEQLKQNRKDHVKAVREIDDYEGDHVFTDASGKRHSICIGPISIDGNGEKRAYNHIITGEQHATVAISLVTGEPLYIWHDQISCIYCQRKWTELLNDDSNDLRAQDIFTMDLSTCKTASFIIISQLRLFFFIRIYAPNFR